MIKVNVEIDNKSWHKKIQRPQKYFNKKLRKISLLTRLFKNKPESFCFFSKHDTVQAKIDIINDKQITAPVNERKTGKREAPEFRPIQ